MEPPPAKKRKLNSNSNACTPETIASLSDEEDRNEPKEDKLTQLNAEQKAKLDSDGYCVLNSDTMQKQRILCAVSGYVRNNFNQKCLVAVLIHTIKDFYNCQYNPDLYAEITCVDMSEADDISNKDNEPIFLAPRVNLSLSNLLSDTENKIRVAKRKVSAESMHKVLQYFGHHKGVHPAPIPKPIRSSIMKNIVTDLWDAQFMDALTKKQIFRVILAANYLDCTSLLHLGAAKVATLMRGHTASELRDILTD